MKTLKLTTIAALCTFVLGFMGPVTASEVSGVRAALAAAMKAFTQAVESGNAAGNIFRDVGLASEAPASAPAAAAAAVDPVGFPENYRSAFRRLSVHTRKEEPAVLTAYGNALAASITQESQLPYPDGAVIVMEWSHSAQNSAVPGDVARVDVMRRGPAYGAAYGENRAGNWGFMSYRVDGSPRISPAQSVECAACHAKFGAEKDFVFRVRAASEGP